MHQLLDDFPHILEDPLSLRLLGEEVVRAIQDRPEEHRSRQARGLRSHIVLRSRFAEEELQVAVESG